MRVLRHRARMDTCITRWLRLVRDQIRLWRERAQGRRELACIAELDWIDLSLKDIGITHAEARQEARKPFWRE